MGRNETDDVEIPSSSMFWLTMLLSSVYFVIFYGGLITGSLVYKHTQWDLIMRSTGWFLSVFQALISVAITKFFIENIRPAPPG